MGQRFTQLQKMKPAMVPYVFEDINLLKMVGAKYTECSPGYTQRYDHQGIPLTALEELARHIKLSDLDMKPNNETPETPALNTSSTSETLDLGKIKELLEKNNVNTKDLDLNNLNLEDIKTLLENNRESPQEQNEEVKVEEL